VMLIRSTRASKEHNKRMQYIMITIALAIEVVVGFTVMLPVGKYYDFNQIGYSFVSILFLVALLKYKLMGIEETTKEYIIDELSAGVIAFDANGNIAYYNKTVPIVFPEIGSDPHTVIERIKKSIETGDPITVNDRIYTFEEKDLNSEYGTGRVYVLTDATRHYYYMEELEGQKKLAEEANKAKSEFLARMSHEIRTPINTVLGMDEMILRDSSDSTVRDYAMDIRRAGSALLSIINDILDLSKVESGKMEISPVEYDVTSMLYDITNVMFTKATDKNLAFNVRIDGTIPSRLYGDDIRIRQVLSNLLSNAVKYTPKGTVSFRATKVAQEDGNVVIRFEVEDTGIGIKAEDMNKLFAAFERIDEKRNRSIEGTGLGMAISVKILELMDSKLNVKSEFGEGSLFWFDIKQETVGAEPLGDFDDRIRNYINEQYVYTNSFEAPDAHVLVVDDNSMNRKVLVSLLKPTGIQITEASGGADAVTLASNNHYDMIFMDHMMPGIDGMEAMKMIRENKEGPCCDTPIFALTANAVSGAKEMYLREGFDGFLTKPIMSDKLEKAIRETLPKDMIMPATDRGTRTDALTLDTDDLPSIFGFDREVAMMRLQDKGVLMSVLEEFGNTLEAQADALETLKEGLPDTLNEYRIQVHGMKGAAGTAGILTLSGMAAIIEKAALAQDFDAIGKLHGAFVREWLDLKEQFDATFGQGEDNAEEKPVIDPEILRVLLELLTSYMNDMDLDGADETIRKLSAYKLPANVEEEFEGLKAAVAQIDWDAVDEILKRIKD
ncbi:MAG: response regulator, partial [Lachnospiraceae bacterium]|nr:response regulator [Lachnospiraceae bacterium]